MAYMPDFGARFDPQGILGNLSGGPQGLLNTPPPLGMQPMTAGVPMPPDPTITASAPAAPPPPAASGWANNPVIAALGSSLLSTPTLREGLASFGQQAPQLIATQRKRQALNAWLKAKSSGDAGALQRATQDLYQADPSIAEGVAAAAMVPGEKSLQFSPMGQGYVFDKKMGTAEPLSGGGMGNADNMPMVNVDANGQRNPDQEKAFLDAIGSPQTAGLVKGIADYTIDPTKALPQRGGQREYVLGLVRQFDPTYDMTQYGVRNKMRLSAEGGGTISQGIQSANMTVQHVAELKKAYDELGNGDVSAVNAASNWANASGVNAANPFISTQDMQAKQAALGKFNAAADAVSSELAKVFKGGGATAEAEVKEWRSGLSPNMSPSEFHAAVDELVGHLLKARLDATRQTYEGAMGKPMPLRVFKGATPKVLQDLGYDPAALEGDTSGAPTPDASAGPPPADAPAAGVTHTWDPQNGLRAVQ